MGSFIHVSGSTRSSQRRSNTSIHPSKWASSHSYRPSLCTWGTLADNSRPGMCPCLQQLALGTFIFSVPKAICTPRSGSLGRCKHGHSQCAWINASNSNERPKRWSELMQTSAISTTWRRQWLCRVEHRPSGARHGGRSAGVRRRRWRVWHKYNSTRCSIWRQNNRFADLF